MVKSKDKTIRIKKEVYNNLEKHVKGFESESDTIQRMITSHEVLQKQLSIPI